MTNFNITKGLKKAFATIGLMIVSFCALVMVGADVIDAATDYTTDVEIVDVDKAAPGESVYVFKNTPSGQVYGTPDSCKNDGYWSTTCNIRTAVNDTDFDYYVVLPTIDGSDYDWASDMTYFQIAFVEKTAKYINPFMPDLEGVEGTIDSDTYPLAIDSTNWYYFGASDGKVVEYKAKDGALSSGKEYVIFIRYKLASTNQIATFEAGYVGYYADFYSFSESELDLITPEVAATTATKSAYDLTAAFGGAYTNLPNLERIEWKYDANSELTLDDFASSNTYLYDNNGNFASYKPAATSVRSTVNGSGEPANGFYAIFIRDRAGNTYIENYEVKNIFSTSTITGYNDEDLFQNLGTAVVYEKNDILVSSDTTGAQKYIVKKALSLTANVKDAAGKNVDESLVSWKVSVKARGTTKDNIDVKTSDFSYSFAQPTTYGTYTITMMVGALEGAKIEVEVRPVITITPTTSASFVYGDKVTFEYSYGNWSKAATSNADDVKNDIILTEGNSYDWKTMKNVGSHTVSASGFTMNYNEYILDYKDVKFQVTPKQLNIKYKNASKTYDAIAFTPRALTAAEAISYFEIEGLKYGETIATISTDQSDLINHGTYTVTPEGFTLTKGAGSSKDATNYPSITDAVADEDNYNLVPVAGKYTIHKIKIVATYFNDSRPYTAEAFASSLFTDPKEYDVTLYDNGGEVIEIETLTNHTISSFTYKMSTTKGNEDVSNPINVGKYYVKAKTAVVMNGTTDVSENFYIEENADGIFEITKIKLIVTFNPTAANSGLTYDGTSYTDDLQNLSNYTFNTKITPALIDEWKTNGGSISFDIQFTCLENTKGTCTNVTENTTPTSSDLRRAGTYKIIPIAANNVPASISDNYDVNAFTSNSGNFVIVRKNISITYNSSTGHRGGKTYDGNPVTFNTPSQWTFTELASSDVDDVTNVTYDIDGTENKSVVDVKGDEQNYLIKVVDFAHEYRDSYTIDTPVVANYKITRRTAAIVMKTQTPVTYNNYEYTFTDVKYYDFVVEGKDGFVSGQEPTAVAYQAKVGGVNKNDIINADTYTIDITNFTHGTGFIANNYDVDLDTDGSFTINKRPITLNITNTSFPFINATYDEELKKISYYTIGGDGYASDETITSVAYTIKSTQTTIKDVGTYNITIDSFVITGNKDTSRAGNLNYSFTATNDSFTVDPVELEISGCTPSPTTRAYNGGTLVTQSGFKVTCTITVNNNSVTVEATGSANFDSKNVGTRNIITGDMTLTNTNYSWKNNVKSYTYTGLGSITAKQISINSHFTANKTSYTKVYDGNTNVTSEVGFDISPNEGVIEYGDDLGLTYTVKFSRANRCEGKNPDTNCNATSNTIVLTVSDWTDKNYNITDTGDTYPAEITSQAATLKVKATETTYGTPATITYVFDPENEAAREATSFDTEFTGLTSDYDATDRSKHKNANEAGYTIIPSFTYENYGNYDVSVNTVANNVVVKKFPISIVYTQGSNKYNYGTEITKEMLMSAAFFPLYTITSPLAYASEEVTAITGVEIKNASGTSVNSMWNSETYKVTVTSFDVSDGSSDDNYSFATTSTGNLTIDPLTLTLTLINKTVIYNGYCYDADIRKISSYTTNLVNDEDKTTWNDAVDALTLSFTATRTYGANTENDAHVVNWGTYAIDVTAITGEIPDSIRNNYNVATNDKVVFVDGTYTINKAELDIKLTASQSKVYRGYSYDTELENAKYYTYTLADIDEPTEGTLVEKVIYSVAGGKSLLNADTYSIKVTGVELAEDATYGDKTQNFTIKSADVDFIITPFELDLDNTAHFTITPATTPTKVYDDSTVVADSVYKIVYKDVLGNEARTDLETQSEIMKITLAFNSKNVDATHIDVTIELLSGNYVLKGNGVSATNPYEKDVPASITARTTAKIITTLNGKKTSETVTYGDPVTVDFVYEGFYYDGRLLGDSPEDQTKAKDQITSGSLKNTYVDSMQNYSPTAYTITGKEATAVNNNYTFAAGNYTSASLTVNRMTLTISYNGHHDEYDGEEMPTTYFTDPDYYTIIGTGSYTTNNVLPYNESVSKIASYYVGNDVDADIINKGTYEIKAKTIEITGGKKSADNYIVDAIIKDGKVFEVTPKSIYFKLKANQTFTYNGIAADAAGSLARELKKIKYYELKDGYTITPTENTEIFGSGDAEKVTYTVVRKVNNTVVDGDTTVFNYGTYELTITGITVSDQFKENYTVQFDSAVTFVVNPVKVVATLSAEDKIYNGKDQEVSFGTYVSYNITYGGTNGTDNTSENGKLLNTDTISSISYKDGDDKVNQKYALAGTYNITAQSMVVTSSAYAKFDNNNYDFSGVENPYTIEKRALIITDFDYTESNLVKTYDGDTSSSVTLTINTSTKAEIAANTGLISGDAVTVKHNPAVYDSKDVESYSNITIANADLEGDDKDNYKLEVKTRTFTKEDGVLINTVKLDLSNQNLYSRQFDNTNKVYAESNVDVDGINSEKLTVSWADNVATFDTAFVGPGKTITISAVTINSVTGSGLASNYHFVANSTMLGNITGIDYDIIPTNCRINKGTMKTYDGNNTIAANFEIICDTPENLIENGMASTFVINHDAATSLYDSEKAKGNEGAATKITFRGLAFADSNFGSKYGFSFEETSLDLVAHIEPKILSIDTFDYDPADLTKTYDGNTDAKVKLVPTGMITDEYATDVIYTDNAYYADPNQGSDKTITVTGKIGNKNYCFGKNGESYTYTATRTFTKGVITKAALTVSVLLYTNENDKREVLSIDYGTSFSYEVVYTGFIGSDVVTTPATVTWSGTARDVGTYTATPSDAVADNYEISYVKATLIINKLAVVVTPDNRQSVKYNQKTYTITYKTTPALPYDDELVGTLTTTPVGFDYVEAQASRKVGTYTITEGDITIASNNPNYTVTFSTTPVTIEVTDGDKPLIDAKNFKVYTDAAGTNEYVSGSTATSPLYFKVEAIDAAYTLNAYNLTLEVYVCDGSGSNCVQANLDSKIAVKPTKAGTNVNDVFGPFADPAMKNGTFKYKFVVKDSTGLASDAFVYSGSIRYLAPVITIDESVSTDDQKVVKFEIEGYSDFLGSRTATWKYFFSRKIAELDESDFNYHGVVIDDSTSKTYTSFVISNGNLSAWAKTPKGLNGTDYKLYLQLTLSDQEKPILYDVSPKFEIVVTIPAAKAKLMSTNYSMGDGSDYSGTMTGNGNALVVANSTSSTPSLMAYNSSNSNQVVTKLDKNGNTIWSLDLSVFGLKAQLIEDSNEETIILATGKSLNLGELSINRTFDDEEVVVLRINEYGQIISANVMAMEGDNEARAIAVKENGYIVVVSNAAATMINMYNSSDALVWSKTIEGEFTINDVDFDADVVALVGVTYTGSYVIDGETTVVRYRGLEDAVLIQMSVSGEVLNIRTIGSSRVDEFKEVVVFGDYIYVLGGSGATMLYHSYGGTLTASGKGGYDSFVALYKKSDAKLYRATFVGGEGDEIHTSLDVNESGFTVVGTTTSKEELKLSGVSGNYVMLPEYENKLTLVYQYEHSLLLTSVGYVNDEKLNITEVGYDNVSGRLMLMSTGSTLAVMVERNFGLEDIMVTVDGRMGYVSIVGDYSDIVISKDGVVLSETSEFAIDSNGSYVISVTDTTGRTVVKTVEITSFIDTAATVSNDTGSNLMLIAAIAGLIMMVYSVLLIKGRKNKDEEIA